MAIDPTNNLGKSFINMEDSDMEDSESNAGEGRHPYAAAAEDSHPVNDESNAGGGSAESERYSFMLDIIDEYAVENNAAIAPAEAGIASTRDRLAESMQPPPYSSPVSPLSPPPEYRENPVSENEAGGSRADESIPARHPRLNDPKFTGPPLAQRLENQRKRDAANAAAGSRGPAAAPATNAEAGPSQPRSVFESDPPGLRPRLMKKLSSMTLNPKGKGRAATDPQPPATDPKVKGKGRAATDPQLPAADPKGKGKAQEIKGKGKEISEPQLVSSLTDQPGPLTFLRPRAAPQPSRGNRPQSSRSATTPSVSTSSANRPASDDDASETARRPPKPPDGWI